MDDANNLKGIGNSPWVSLIEQSTYEFEEIAAKLHELFETQHIDVQDKSVFLKISLVFPVRNPERVKMIITNPIVTMALAEVLCQHSASCVYIGDAETLGPARYAFAMTDMHKHFRLLSPASQRKVKFAYLDEWKKEWMTPDDPVIPGIRLDFPQIVQDIDVFISLPKLKVNIFADITLSVKNGMGLISKPTRLQYHGEQLHGMIADIYQLRPPDYVITDAIYAGEGQGPMEATPYPTNLLICGNNGLAVDTVCCNLMGYAPREIQHLVYLEERGYGSLELENIALQPDNRALMDRHRHQFVRPDLSLDSLSPQIHVYEGTCCASGCKPFIRAILDGYGLHQGWESLGELHIILGKNQSLDPATLEQLPKKRTIILGKCAEEYRSYGAFFGGCSPDYIAMLERLPLKTDLPISPWGQYVSLGTYVKTAIQHVLRTFVKKTLK